MKHYYTKNILMAFTHKKLYKLHTLHYSYYYYCLLYKIFMYIFNLPLSYLFITHKENIFFGWHSEHGVSA